MYHALSGEANRRLLREKKQALYYIKKILCVNMNEAFLLRAYEFLPFKPISLTAVFLRELSNGSTPREETSVSYGEKKGFFKVFWVLYFSRGFKCFKKRHPAFLKGLYP